MIVCEPSGVCPPTYYLRGLGPVQGTVRFPDRYPYSVASPFLLLGMPLANTYKCECPKLNHYNHRKWEETQISFSFAVGSKNIVTFLSIHIQNMTTRIDLGFGHPLKLLLVSPITMNIGPVSFRANIG